MFPCRLLRRFAPTFPITGLPIGFQWHSLYDTDTAELATALPRDRSRVSVNPPRVGARQQGACTNVRFRGVQRAAMGRLRRGASAFGTDQQEVNAPCATATPAPEFLSCHRSTPPQPLCPRLIRIPRDFVGTGYATPLIWT